MKRQRTDNEKMYYHVEDMYLWPESQFSFTYQTTWRYVDDDGKKQSI